MKPGSQRDIPCIEQSFREYQAHIQSVLRGEFRVDMQYDLDRTVLSLLQVESEKGEPFAAMLTHLPCDESASRTLRRGNETPDECVAAFYARSHDIVSQAKLNQDIPLLGYTGALCGNEEGDAPFSNLFVTNGPMYCLIRKSDDYRADSRLIMEKLHEALSL